MASEFGISGQDVASVVHGTSRGREMSNLSRLGVREFCYAKTLDFKFTLTMAGYNLIRLPKLLAA